MQVKDSVEKILNIMTLLKIPLIFCSVEYNRIELNQPAMEILCNYDQDKLNELILGNLAKQNNSEIKIDEFIFSVAKYEGLGGLGYFISVVTHTQGNSNEFTKLAYSNKMLETILKNSYDPILVTDGEGNILKWNLAFEKVFQTYTDLKYINVRQLMATGIYKKSSVLEVIKTKKPVTYVIELSNGYSSISTSTPIFDEKGNIIYIITNGRDLAELERLKRMLIEAEEMKQRYVDELKYLRNNDIPKSLICESPNFYQVIRLCNQVTESNATILLLGESGVGKDAVAKYIHIKSSRRDLGFIAINCAAIPESLLEAELFGYEAGSFTGAKSQGKKGLFEVAHKGTLFLDEIGDMPLGLQAKILRVLESGEILRVGGCNSIKVDVRIIAATNRDLKNLIEKNQFRQDLYYRLSVLPIWIPPLRERPEDLVALTNYYLSEFCTKYNCHKKICSETLTEMSEYSWPGNIRELRNMIERWVLTSASEEIRFSLLHTLSQDTKKQDIKEIEDTAHIITLKERISNVEKETIEQAMKALDKNKSKVAQRLGVQRSVLYRMLEKYNIK